MHIADLHIGKRLKDISLLEDQKIILSAIVGQAVEHQVDAVLVAGDVYQKASPQSEAMTVFNDFVTALCDNNIKVYVISGNHDSDQRIAYFSALLKKSGVYVSERFSGSIQKVETEDAFGPLTIWLLPFLKPAMVRRFYPEDTINTYQDAMESVLARADIDKSRRNVLVAHQFITGATPSDSEEMAVGGLDNIDSYIFDDFDYVALGHVHMPQRAGRKTCRYAGSMMKYSRSEAGQTKSSLLVEMAEKGNISVTRLPLPVPHDLREITGTFEEVMSLPYSEDYVFITLTDELIAPDARVTVATVFPNMLGFGVQNSKTKEDRDIQAFDVVDRKDWMALFRDFYRLQNNDAPVPESHAALLTEIAREIKEDGYEAD